MPCLHALLQPVHGRQKVDGLHHHVASANNT